MEQNVINKQKKPYRKNTLREKENQKDKFKNK